MENKSIGPNVYKLNYAYTTFENLFIGNSAGSLQKSVILGKNLFTRRDSVKISC